MGRSARARAPFDDSTFRYPGEVLGKQWERLHRGDREPFPDARRIGRLSKGHAELAAWVEAQGGAAAVAGNVQDAWREFHAGNFRRAIETGSKLRAFGASAANKAAAIQAASMPEGAAGALQLLQAATRRGEQAIAELPETANAHYMLALVLGRYSQRISIMKALAEGLGGRVRALLERALELEPRHADAHIAFGLYHAEVVGKLGSLVAGLTYGASAREAVGHFRRALELAPAAPIAHVEYAQGLLLLDARAHRAEANELYERAADCKPADAMEALDVERARRALA
jgi:tetratricopeptide (TPR) repeat protein